MFEIELELPHLGSRAKVQLTKKKVHFTGSWRILGCVSLLASSDAGRIDGGASILPASDDTCEERRPRR